ncbi:uncharacterized protein LTR77_009746 [Saxophila tyrrhenica]|uniref:Uncharacterized protein n=1 Tax=Saxophila tyrrhenica TaxID=1690608 RepID=A0AAV9NZR7_9PEZI|nr:hypothetical protein LTR77_009746 [Saxophila tyrrhenica]
MPKLQDHVVQALVGLSPWIRAESIELIYNNTKEGSALRRLALYSFMAFYFGCSDYDNPTYRKHYKQGVTDRLGALPSFMVDCFGAMNVAPCGSLPCQCGSSSGDPICYEGVIEQNWPKEKGDAEDRFGDYPDGAV